MRTKPCLTSADVKKMMAACAAEAEKNKWKVAIAIVDDGGHIQSAYGLAPGDWVLVRPDGYVAWRSRSGASNPMEVLRTAFHRMLGRVSAMA